MPFKLNGTTPQKGDSQALEYYLELDDKDRIRVLKLFKLMGDVGMIRDETGQAFER